MSAVATKSELFENRAGKHPIQRADGVLGPGDFRNPILPVAVECQNCLGLGDVRLSLRDQRSEKERTPPCPIAVPGHAEQAVVVFVSVAFKILAQGRNLDATAAP